MLMKMFIKFFICSNFKDIIRLSEIYDIALRL